MRKTLFVFASALLLAGSAFGRTTQYLDVLRIKVKPEKRTEFETAVKRLAQANRHNNGDRWVALATEYGENNTITMITGRSNYSDIDRGFELFEGAVTKAAGGKAGLDKLMQDFSSSILGSRGEIRRVRWDLSENSSDPEASTNVIAASRWVRTIRIQVRPGRSPEYESLLKDLKTAVERSSYKKPVRVSQAYDGTSGGTYYVSMYGTKLGDFDDIPKLSEMLGAEGYQTYLKTTADLVLRTESELARFRPELSAPTKQFIDADPKFWNPKPAPVAMAKPKAKTQ